MHELLARQGEEALTDFGNSVPRVTTRATAAALARPTREDTTLFAKSRALQNKLKLRQLALIVELDNCQSLHKAADRLGMSQPAATRLIHEIEDLLEASLFVRTSKGMEPTDMGRLMIRHASMLLSSIEHVYDEALALRSGEGGSIRVGIFPGAPQPLLGSAIADLKAKSPTTDVRVHEGTNESLLTELRDGSLDIVVGRAPSVSESHNTTFELLFTEFFSVVTGPKSDIERHVAMEIGDLVDHPWILPFPNSALRKNLDVHFFSKCGRLPSNLVESVSVPFNLSLITAENFVAVMPRWLAQEHARRGELRVLIRQIPNITGPIGLLTRANEILPPQALRLVCAIRLRMGAFGGQGDTEIGSPRDKS